MSKRPNATEKPSESSLEEGSLPKAIIEASKVVEVGSKLSIHRRMLLVFEWVTHVMKNDLVQMTDEKSYQAVTHDDVSAALHVPLARAGIFPKYEQEELVITEFETEKPGWNGGPPKKTKWYRADVKVKVSFINADKPDEFIEYTGRAYALDTSDKAPAKATSLALKVIDLKAFKLESRDKEESRDFEKQTEWDQREYGEANPNRNQRNNTRTAPKSGPTPKPESKPVPKTNAPAGKLATPDEVKALLAFAKQVGLNETGLRDTLSLNIQRNDWNNLTAVELITMNKALQKIHADRASASSPTDSNDEPPFPDETQEPPPSPEDESQEPPDDTPPPKAPAQRPAPASRGPTPRGGPKPHPTPPDIAAAQARVNAKASAPAGPDDAPFDEFAIGFDILGREGEILKGLKLKSIAEGDLKHAIKEFDRRMKTVPPPDNMTDMFEARHRIAVFLKSRGVMV